jgi:rare lipoprotein A
MSIHLLAASAAALLLIVAPLSNAQPAEPAVIAEPVQASASTGAPPRAKHANAAQGKVASHGRMAYYGGKFAGRKTASGERFDPGAMTMAHRTLPFGTKVRVTNVKNHKSVVVRVNDRGPSSRALVGDLTTAAAGKIGMLHAGTAKVRLQVLGTGKAHKATSARHARTA